MNRDWAHQRSLCKRITKDESDEHLKRHCSGKFQHSTYESANTEALRMTARYRQEKVFDTYECEYCGYHHIGRKFED